MIKLISMLKHLILNLSELFQICCLYVFDVTLFIYLFLFYIHLPFFHSFSQFDAMLTYLAP